MNKLVLVGTAGVGAAGGFLAGKGMAGGATKGAASIDGAASQSHETMQRIVHIARIRDGNEADLRRLVENRFPASAVAGTAIREITTFIGSTYMLTEYGFTGEYTPTFAAFRGNPVINRFLEEAGRLLDDEPAPLPDAPAMQFLASQALRWDREHGVQGTPHVRPKEASTDRV